MINHSTDCLIVSSVAIAGSKRIRLKDDLMIDLRPVALEDEDMQGKVEIKTYQAAIPQTAR